MVFWIFVIKMGLAKLSQTHFCSMAEGRGVEPRFTESESIVIIKELTNKVKHDRRTVKKIKMF